MGTSPAVLLILGAAAVPLLGGWPRRALMVLMPVACLIALWMLPEGTGASVNVFGLELILVRVDALSRVFATGFLIAALLTAVYALHLRDSLQQAVVVVLRRRRGGCLARGRPTDAVRVLGTRRSVIGLPDLGGPHRAQLSGRDALPGRAGDLRAC